MVLLPVILTNMSKHTQVASYALYALFDLNVSADKWSCSMVVVAYKALGRSMIQTYSNTSYSYLNLLLTIQSKGFYIKKITVDIQDIFLLSSRKTMYMTTCTEGRLLCNTSPLRSFWSKRHIKLLISLLHYTWVSTCTLPRIASFSSSL